MLLVGEGHTRHWIRIAGWEHVERDLEKQTSNYWEEARELARKLHRAIPEAFPRFIDWSKIHTCSQSTDESVRDYYNRFQVVFKENSGLPSDIDSTCVSFNSLFVNGLNKNLSILVRRSRMGGGTMPTLELVNLANELASTLDESP